jgi:hypothetical protein
VYYHREEDIVVQREIEEIVPIPSARNTGHSFDVTIAGERAWLVRYCVRLVGDLDAAKCIVPIAGLFWRISCYAPYYNKGKRKEYLDK